MAHATAVAVAALAAKPTPRMEPVNTVRARVVRMEPHTLQETRDHSTSLRESDWDYDRIRIDASEDECPMEVGWAMSRDGCEEAASEGEPHTDLYHAQQQS
jgi:hypothetical protein